MAAAPPPAVAFLPVAAGVVDGSRREKLSEEKVSEGSSEGSGPESNVVGAGPEPPGKVRVPPPPSQVSPLGQQPLGMQVEPMGQPAPPSEQQW